MFDLDLGLASGGSTFTAGAISTGNLVPEVPGHDLRPHPGDVRTQFKKGYETSAKDSGKKGSHPR